MQTITRSILILKILILLCSGLLLSPAWAGAPLWTFQPLTATTIAVPANGTAVVQYRVTSQTSKPHILELQPVRAITQLTTGLGVCGNPFVLRGNRSCILSLQINGSELTGAITGGPVVCQQGSTIQCYQPQSENILRITQASPITEAVISVAGSPLTLTQNGTTGQLTISNTTLEINATNITSNFTGTALDGNVTETGNTCANVPPGGSCTLTYTPGSTAVPQTNFTIQGSNTNAISAAITIQEESILTGINPASGSASGGTGVTLTGSGLTGATSITFGGIAATNINVVNSTTVTAVTPANAAGAVDVTITTPAGSSTLTNGYTYLATALGQAAYGGTIACLNTGNNLIASTADNSTNTLWSPIGINIAATSTTDGMANTIAIVDCLTNGVGTGCFGGSTLDSYAAGICSSYEVDSQGNSPCQPGNACYNDWFLPAGNNLTVSGQLNCLYSNQVAIGGFAADYYWSSTESSGIRAYVEGFVAGDEQSILKGTFAPRVRCVRSFVP